MDKQELKQWAASHETHEAVAVAIHQMSDDCRSPGDIWEEPTEVEAMWIERKVAQFAAERRFGLDASGESLPWGAGRLLLVPKTSFVTQKAHRVEQETLRREREGK